MADNSKFFWIKLRTDFFAEDSKIDDLMNLGAPNGAEYVCLYLKLCLMTANKGGRLCSERGEVIIPYNAEKIARDAKYFSVDTVVVAMELYRRLGLIYEEKDGVLAITDAETMVGSESASRPAIKMRNYREKLKAAKVTQVVTNCNPEIVTNCPTDIRDKENRDIENKDIKKKAPAAPVYFPEQPELNDLFIEYAKMRKAIKAPLTEAACKLELNRLKELSGGDEATAKKILEQAISKSWRGLYPLKDDKPAQKSNQFNSFKQGPTKYEAKFMN